LKICGFYVLTDKHTSSDGWNEGTDRWINSRTYRQTKGRTIEQMDSRTEGRSDEWTDGLMDMAGRIGRHKGRQAFGQYRTWYGSCEEKPPYDDKK
jgi:hypothetical protein